MWFGYEKKATDCHNLFFFWTSEHHKILQLSPDLKHFSPQQVFQGGWEPCAKICRAK